MIRFLAGVAAFTIMQLPVMAYSGGCRVASRQASVSERTTLPPEFANVIASTQRKVQVRVKRVVLIDQPAQANCRQVPAGSGTS
jgi:hypothetical protein